MNDVSLWQNEIQFPVKNIWDSLNIFYISDIHLEFHIEGFETIKKRSLPPAIRKLVIDIFGENKDRAKRGYFDYIIIDGDTEKNPPESKLHQVQVMEQRPSAVPEDALLQKHR